MPVTAQGHIVQDGILMRDAKDRYTLTGPPASQSWIFFQVQGPHALALVEKVLAGHCRDEVLTHGAAESRRPPLPRAAPRHGRTGGV